MAPCSPVSGTLFTCEWHLAHLWRHGRRGILQLDGEPTVNGTARGAFTQLTLTLDLFLGGHRNFDEVARNAEISESFHGCIQKVLFTGFRTLNVLPPVLRLPRQFWSFHVKPYGRNDGNTPEKNLTCHVRPFKVTQGHWNRHGSVGSVYISISDP